MIEISRNIKNISYSIENFSLTMYICTMSIQILIAKVIALNLVASFFVSVLSIGYDFFSLVGTAITV